MKAIKKWLTMSTMIALLLSSYLAIDGGLTTENAYADVTSKIWAYGRNTIHQKPDGTLLGWGQNGSQQLVFTSPFTYVIDPTPLADSTVQSLVDFAGTTSSAIGLKADGTVYGWGSNNVGEAGVGTTTAQKTPGQVITSDGNALTNIKALAANENGSTMYALDNAGSVWGWGYNNVGQLGVATTTASSNKAVKNVYLTNIKSVSGGSTHTLAVKADGTVWTWGKNDVGQLGIGATDATLHYIPSQVKASSSTTLYGVTQVAAGSGFSAALKQDGTVVAWGTNYLHSMGNGSSTSVNHLYPTQVLTSAGTPLTDVQQIKASVNAVLALKKDGTVWEWGYLGSPPLIMDNATATEVVGLSDIIAVDLGIDHAVALKRDGTVYSWGQNSQGELGTGDSSGRATPTPLSSLFTMNASAKGVSTSEIDLSFYATGGSVDHFDITRSPSMLPVTVKNSSYADTTVTPGQTYTYTITAFDASSNVMSNKQVSATVPTSIDVNLKATAIDSSSVQLDYSANGTVSKWMVLRNGVEINAATGAVDSGLAPGTTYTYTVEAYHASGVKIGSATKSVTTAPLAEVVQISATAAATSSSNIDISFGAVTGIVDHYKVYRLPDLTEVSVLNGSKAVDTNLNSSTTYSYKVISYNNAGAEIGNSVVVSAKTFAQVSFAVTPVATSPNATRIDYTVTGNTADVDHYVVTRAGQTQPIYTGTALTATDSGLTPETTYSYTVTAYDAAGHVIGQGVGTVKTLAVVTVPFDMTVYQQQTPPNQVKLTFVPNRTVAKYVVNKNGQKVYEGAQSEFTDTSLVAGPYYQYEIIAYDAEGKELGRKSGYVSIGNNGNTNPSYPYPGYPTPGYPTPGMPYPGPMYYYPITITVTVGIPYPAPMYNPYPYPQYPVPQYPYPQQQYPYPQYPQYPQYPTPQYPQYPNTQYPQFPNYPQQTLQAPQQAQYPQFTQSPLYPQVQSFPAA